MFCPWPLKKCVLDSGIDDPSSYDIVVINTWHWVDNNNVLLVVGFNYSNKIVFQVIKVLKQEMNDSITP